MNKLTKEDILKMSKEQLLNASTVCIDCTDCTACTDCRHCEGCTDCWYCIDCTDCTACTDCRYCRYCYKCVGLIGEMYCILNVQLTKEEYEKKMKEIKND